MSNKLVQGKELQVKFDPEALEIKNRAEWGMEYLGKQWEKGAMASKVAMFGIGAVVFVAIAVLLHSLFAIAAIACFIFALKAQLERGLRLSLIEDWESKRMVRIDK